MRKIILASLAIFLGMSSSFAMSKSEPAQTPKVIEASQQSDKLVDIYAKDDQSSEVVGQIYFKSQDNYNIFYCKQNNWCEVVNKDNGDTGWISLEQLKQAQQKVAKIMQKKNAVKRLEEYMVIQDQKIAQLYAMMTQQQQEFAKIIEQQQAQINQLKQAYYYR
ncbi:SH3 domain-containing protein [Francisella philomiragia]|uniref:SH3 domain-containing protein n=1 Tax=Francisella philomiragia TaxID=28110 RepID=UPI001903930C|nr:SH3 domain-containing protein [Francisella philomiragia]MBK2093828.1 hypothetical protein [Francisella philomiragia]MBK2256298.1 hypothetical protein [Francisella philomiragia]MBK2268956.1 hypothetical protein [Francisella philomiragia]MBK2270570.1 hypothetical protein [Francisella philomiragia]MBK2274349.1 hypothetical protein [Francisella philomiragia]